MLWAMRSQLIVGLGFLALVAGDAGAQKKAADKPAAEKRTAERSTSDKAADKKGEKGMVSTEGTGEVRSIKVHDVKLAPGRAPATGEKAESSAAVRPPDESAPAAPLVDEDLQRERVLKQMRKYEKAVAVCSDAAKKRGKSGEVQLALNIVERKVTPAVVQNTTGDQEIVKCLTKASAAWQLPAARLTVPYTVTVEK